MEREDSSNTIGPAVRERTERYCGPLGITAAFSVCIALLVGNAATTSTYAASRLADGVAYRSQGSDEFMRAVKFALTGWDEANVTEEGPGSCTFLVVDVTRPKDQEFFYLNNVDRSKLRFHWRQQLFSDAWVPLADVTLVGDQPVHEYRPADNNSRRQVKTNRYKLTIYSVTDYQRLVRSWKYIYAHGCTGTLSSDRS